ncbi:MAG: amino acid permease [Gammaproteobacteria bacterium GWE2_42_36]|nr:MAG: amino acid permease [Gammaproteobacteria bacterium GWE2_42_36]
MPKRSISLLATLFTSISAIIGSGWLFSAFYTAEYAGPASLLSWVIGGIAIIIVAFIFAELCSMIPVSGSSVRIPQFTHGNVVSFLFAWMIWLSYLALMAIEVQATVQYANYYFPVLIVGDAGHLSSIGYVVATSLMLLVTIINVYSLRWLIRCNSFLTILKLLIPVIIAGVILAKFFRPEDVLHPAHSRFFSLGFHGVLGAISTGGILFAFNGFKQAAEMAGEVERPAITIPIALVGSIIFCLLIYLLLQLAFNASIQLINIPHGWANLTLQNNNSPFAAILAQDELSFLLPLVYIGAIIAPFAASLMYASSAGRSLSAMSENGYMPTFLRHLSAQGNPLYAIIINFFFAICLFAPLPGWDSMMSFLTSLLAVTYGIGPVCLLALRYQLPNQPRPLKLPFGSLWATVAFYICTLLIYFSGWHIVSKMGIAIGIGLLLLLVQHAFSRNPKKSALRWRESIWIWPYFIGLSIFSYLGDYGGGIQMIDVETILWMLAIFCILIMVLAVIFRLPSHEVKEALAQIKNSE